LIVTLLKWASLRGPDSFTYRRFPVTYNAGPFQGQGTVWNLSRSGLLLSGDGERKSLSHV
jgi:hypothetical protein